jgi:hypothetical protein
MTTAAPTHCPSSSPSEGDLIILHIPLALPAAGSDDEGSDDDAGSNSSKSTPYPFKLVIPSDRITSMTNSPAKLLHYIGFTVVSAQGSIYEVVDSHKVAVTEITLNRLLENPEYTYLVDGM